MNNHFTRREFLATSAAIGAAALTPSLLGAPQSTNATRHKIQTFDYLNVALKDSRWKTQYQACRDFYFGVNDDDILHGWRQAANLPAPGKPLGGWCATNSNTVFGQWLQGMTRIARANNDAPLREKAIRLFSEWVKTLPPDGNPRMNHYPFEKLVGGLVDLKRYANHDPAVPILDKVIAYASDAPPVEGGRGRGGAGGRLDRTRTPANPRPWILHSGTPLEWYTLSENLFRAFELTNNPKHKEFADVWRYDTYWDKFAGAGGADAKDVWGVHAYSHVNSFSSCAMAYAVTGDPKLLQILKNAYDFMQTSQTFATGGYGPVERLLPPNAGNLGLALESRQNTCETPCCSWAAFKMARYLMTFTGEARYGDWIEKLFYNGIGASLPITENGKNFYYADYSLGGAYKTYARSTYTCCSGTYIQAVAEYTNLIYFQDNIGLYVNLYVPSEVTWQRDNTAIKVTQETTYPEGESSTFTFTLPTGQAGLNFAIHFRIPSWATNATLAVNGTPAMVDAKPGTWARFSRDWKTGDKIELHIPLSFRFAPVDKQHPDRVAVVRGPVVMVQDAAVHEPLFALPKSDEELNQVLVRAGGQNSNQYALTLTGKNAALATAANSPANAQTPQAGARFQPFYAIPEVNGYRMYFDRKEEPTVMW